MALGAKVASPGSRVICVCGDGGFGHVWSEIETAVRADLPVTLIVLNNAILGFQRHSELFQFNTYTSAIDFSAVDHAAVAMACGADGISIDQADEFRPALEKALQSERMTLIDVRTDPNAYPPITLWDADSSRIDAAAI
jgi:acetolactate synthase-1/2/3 large subunit